MSRRRLMAGLLRVSARIGRWVLGKLLRLGALGLAAWFDGQVDKYLDQARAHQEAAGRSRTARARRRHVLRARWLAWRAGVWVGVRRWLATHGPGVVRELEDAAERSIMDRRLAGVPRTPDAWRAWLAAHGGDQ